jgi:hypothetical protein
MKKSVIAIVCLAILFAAPFASAGFWQWLTGKATAQNTDVYVPVGNSAPVVTTPIITPNPAYKASTLNCTTFVVDRDMDTMSVNFTWYNGSVSYSSEVVSGKSNGTYVSSLLASSVQSKLEIWNCTVFANDTTDNSAAQSATITISNTDPTIPTVSSISPQSPIEGGLTNVTFTFTAQDNDSYYDLNSSTATAQFTTGVETPRSASCTVVSGSGSGNTQDYTCSVFMKYYDEAATWAVSVGISDSSAASATNTSTNFSYGSLTAFTLAPSTLTWPTLSPGSSGQKSDNDPTVLNNTGNYVVSTGNIFLNGTNLNGTGFDKTSVIGVGNFTWNLIDTCAANPVAYQSYGSITGLGLSRGAVATSNIYYCLDVPASTVKQTYSNAGRPWIIKIA